MKVCILTDSLDPDNGPGRYAAEMISALESRVTSLDVLLPTAHGPVAEPASPRLRLHRVLPSRHFFYLRRPLFDLVVLAKALQIVPIVRHADVVHAFKDYPFSLIAAVAAVLCRKKLVVNAYGTFSVIPSRSWPDRSLLAFVYRRAERIVSISHYTKRRVAEFAGSEKILVIQPAVESRRFLTPIESRPRGEWKRPFILSVGQIKRRKGFDVSLRAFGRLAADFPDLHYYLAGERGEEGDHQALREVIAAESAGDRIQLLGRVTERELTWLYQNCELFLLTPRADPAGRFEGFGLVYLEAGACGKAVIGARDCGAEDAVVDGETGLLTAPGDVDEVTYALRSLLEDRELADRLGQRGRERAEALTWEAVADAVVAVYSSLADG